MLFIYFITFTMLMLYSHYRFYAVFGLLKLLPAQLIIEQISQWLSYVGQAMTNSGLLVNWHFLTNCHQMETQNLVISFDYS